MYLLYSSSVVLLLLIYFAGEHNNSFLHGPKSSQLRDKSYASPTNMASRVLSCAISSLYGSVSMLMADLLYGISINLSIGTHNNFILLYNFLSMKGVTIFLLSFVRKDAKVIISTLDFLISSNTFTFLHLTTSVGQFDTYSLSNSVRGSK